MVCVTVTREPQPRRKFDRAPSGPARTRRRLGAAEGDVLAEGGGRQVQQVRGGVEADSQRSDRKGVRRVGGHHAPRGTRSADGGEKHRGVSPVEDLVCRLLLAKKKLLAARRFASPCAPSP